MKHKITITAVLCIAIFIAACGGNDSGEPATGEEIYDTRYMRAGGVKCSECHTLEEQGAGQIVSLASLSEQAAERVEGMSAEAYVRQSILDPNAHLIDGSSRSAMPANYGEILSDEEIDNLVAFLLQE